MRTLGVAATDAKGFYRRWTQMDADELRQQRCHFAAGVESQLQFQ